MTNRRTVAVAATLALTQVLLAGCATPPAIGMFEDTTEVLQGDASLEYDNYTKMFVKAGDFTLRGRNTGLVCTGSIAITHTGLDKGNIPMDMTCRDQGGEVTAQCGTGRLLEATWKADSCQSGTGQGRDSEGTAFAFTFGIPESRALDWIERQLGTQRDGHAGPRADHAK